MSVLKWPEWAWVGRDRGHVWHIIKQLALTDEVPTTFCGKSVLNVRKQGTHSWAGVEKCAECIRLAGLRDVVRPGLAWPRPCLVCGLEVAESDQSPEHALAMHNECVPEYEERRAEVLRDAQTERVS